jgi:hypothetical protein
MERSHEVYFERQGEAWGNDEAGGGMAAKVIDSNGRTG